MGRRAVLRDEARAHPLRGVEPRRPLLRKRRENAGQERAGAGTPGRQQQGCGAQIRRRRFSGWEQEKSASLRSRRAAGTNQLTERRELCETKTRGASLSPLLERGEVVEREFSVPRQLQACCC